MRRRVGRGVIAVRIQLNTDRGEQLADLVGAEDDVRRADLADRQVELLREQRDALGEVEHRSGVDADGRQP